MIIQAKAAANLKFLNDALSNIEDLVSALSSRIDELDEEEAQAAVKVPRDEEERVAMVVAAEERKEKRVQLEQLKENVTVLAGNLQTLVEKAQGEGEEDEDNLLLISEDMEKIESVITETATMLMMLSHDEDEVLLPEDDLVQGTILIAHSHEHVITHFLIQRTTAVS